MDLENYLRLWNARGLGWPGSASAPAGNAHISDWLTDAAKKGLSIKSYDLEPLAIQVTDNVAVVHYRIKLFWVDKEGKTTPSANRITHTWMRNRGNWQIIGGMSGQVDAQGR